jgi:hypothetical protein
MTKVIHERLQGEALDTLIGLAIDHLLALPLHQLINASSLARTTAATLRQATRSNQTETWLRERIVALQANIPEGTLGDYVPGRVVQPIRDIVVRPVVPDRALVGRLIEHGAVEGLLRELLVNALQGFARRLRPSGPGGDRTASRLRSLKRVSEGILGGLGAEIERQAEQKAKDFVDSILSSVIAQAADDLCDPNKAESYGRFRGHLLDQLMNTPFSELNREFNKLDPETLVATATAAARALSERTGLEGEIEALITLAIADIGDQTAGQILTEAGMADAWRAEVEVRAAQLARNFTATDAFGTWLEQLLTD